MVAVTQDGDSLRFASAELKADWELVLTERRLAGASVLAQACGGSRWRGFLRMHLPIIQSPATGASLSGYLSHKRNYELQRALKRFSVEPCEEISAPYKSKHAHDHNSSSRDRSMCRVRKTYNAQQGLVCSPSRLRTSSRMPPILGLRWICTSVCGKTVLRSPRMGVQLRSASAKHHHNRQVLFLELGNIFVEWRLGSQSRHSLQHLPVAYCETMRRTSFTHFDRKRRVDRRERHDSRWGRRGRWRDHRCKRARVP